MATNDGEMRRVGVVYEPRHHDMLFDEFSMGDMEKKKALKDAKRNGRDPGVNSEPDFLFGLSADRNGEFLVSDNDGLPVRVNAEQIELQAPYDWPTIRKSDTSLTFTQRKKPSGQFESYSDSSRYHAAQSKMQKVIERDAHMGFVNEDGLLLVKPQGMKDLQRWIGEHGGGVTERYGKRGYAISAKSIIEGVEAEHRDFIPFSSSSRKSYARTVQMVSP